MDISIVPVPKDQWEIPVRPEQQVTLELQDRQVIQDQWVQQAQQVIQARQAPQGLPELLVPLGHQVLLVPPVPQEPPARPDLPVLLVLSERQAQQDRQGW